MIENYSKEAKVKGAKVLFVEWGTSGRIRPTLRTLQKLLVKALMFKAADAIANMLGGKYLLTVENKSKQAHTCVIPMDIEKKMDSGVH